MNTVLLNTMCAASMCAVPLAAGVTPESFSTSLQRVIASQTIDAEIVEGEIRSIADDKASFLIRPTDGLPMTIQVNDDTVYLLDGEKSDRDSVLKVGRNAKVTHEHRVAARVEATTE